ncbi:MAG: nitroreductase family deazaflavin-dependent oxidoreductase [Thaumarchaeota archaeon]|nr:nitroreductase family deazaflavin-dependent oxidoreductase [Nitrososphaerota archaeon]
MDTKSLEAVKKREFIYLTTRGRKTGKSHTVELWFAFAAGKIYLSHEGEHTDWMKNLRKTDSVGARIDSVKFDAKATIVGEGSSRELGKRARYEKYYKPASKEVIDDWFELSTVIELTPLQAQ